MSRNLRALFSVLLLTVLLPSCMVVDLMKPKIYAIEHHLNSAETGRLNITSAMPEDSLVMSMIRPYQVELDVRMSRVIGYAGGTFSNARPDGSLGDLASDILRRTASERLGFSVDVGLTNWGGLRVPINEGRITVGDIFAVMPFENHLVILTMTGQQIRALADFLAANGTHPVSGLRMRVQDGEARDVLVGTRPINDAEIYTVVTTNFLADGGDHFHILKDAEKREDMDILMRDAMIRYITDRYNITPTSDGRLR